MMTRIARAQPVAWLRQRWKTFRSGLWLEAGQYDGNYGRMDQLYTLEDPWKLGSLREQERFAQTNALIARAAPDCGGLLEIGSGEGMQTAYLMQVSRHVTGLEVSPVAVERARTRLPDADFLEGPAEDVAALVGDRRFDVITACEVLYYSPDVAAILETLKTIAPRILVTNYEKRARLLAKHFEGEGWARLPDIAISGTRWRCHLWTAPGA